MSEGGRERGGESYVTILTGSGQEGAQTALQEVYNKVSPSMCVC